MQTDSVDSLQAGDKVKLLCDLGRGLFGSDAEHHNLSCGALVRDRTLLLPYGIADSFADFASVKLDDLIKAMA